MTSYVGIVHIQGKINGLAFYIVIYTELSINLTKNDNNFSNSYSKTFS